MSERKFGRREFLVIAAAAGAAGAIAATEGALNALNLAPVDPAKGPALAPANPTAGPAASPTAGPGRVGSLGWGRAATPDAKPVSAEKAIEKNGVRITGVPEKIESGHVVDVAKGPFKNTIGLGTEGFVAEPGGLLVGPDFGSKSARNPHGENPAGWDAMYDSEGSIRPFSAVSQEVLRYNGPAFQNLPEGGFVLAQGGEMTVKIGTAVIELNAEQGTNYFVIVRGLFADGRQDSDKNATLEFTKYKPGHVLVNMYEAREKTNTAFISEGQFLQMARASHSSASNCGAEGCSRLRVVCFDTNTRALTIVEQVQGRFANPKEGWQAVFRNWETK